MENCYFLWRKVSAPCLSPLSCLVARKGFIGSKASSGLLNLHGGKPSAQPLVKYSGPLFPSPAEHIGCTWGAFFPCVWWGEMVALLLQSSKSPGCRTFSYQHCENPGVFLNSVLRICHAFYPKCSCPALWQPQEQCLSSSVWLAGAVSENQHH